MCLVAMWPLELILFLKILTFSGLSPSNVKKYVFFVYAFKDSTKGRKKRMSTEFEIVVDVAAGCF